MVVTPVELLRSIDPAAMESCFAKPEENTGRDLREPHIDMRILVI
jgi:hypothetical protein